MKKNYVGINFGHDAGVTAINRNGIFTVLSERVNCFKQSSEINKEIFLRALNLSNLKENDIKDIGISCTQGRSVSYNDESLFIPTATSSLSGELMLFGDSIKPSNTYFGHYLTSDYTWKTFKYPSRKSLIYENLKNKSISNIRNTKLSLSDLVTKISTAGELNNKNLYFIDHHLAHCFDGITKANNLKKTLIVSLDGATTGFSEMIPITFAGMSMYIKDNNIQKITPTMFFGGALYSRASSFAGLTEGKLMGLSSYASSKLDNKSILKIIKKLEEPNMHNFCSSVLLPALSKVNTVEFRNENEFLTSLESRNLPSKSVIALAANTQKIFEYYYKNFIQKIIDKELPENLVIVGGCALNCPSNTMLINNNPEVNILISNSCNDEGISNGCAQFIKYFKEKKLNIVKQTSPFQGEYLLDNNKTSKKYKLGKSRIIKTKTKKELSEIILNELLNNKFGMLCRERYEIGPRALCNRSLIARADKKINHQIMNKIKEREQWRPLAPVTSHKYFNTYFKGPMNPYMLATQKVILPKKIPAVCHVDLSARCQLVSLKDDLICHILDSLEQNSIPPILINTSLNSKGEPILNSTERIIEFFNSFDELSFLVLDQNIILKN